MFIHGNPGSSADWEPLLPPSPACARGGLGRARASARPASPTASRRRVASARRLHRRRALERARHRARPPGRCTTSAGRGASSLGGRRSPSASRERDAHRHRACCPATAGTALARLWRTRGARRAASWPPPRGSGFRTLLRRGQPARPARRRSSNRMYDDFDRGDPARRAASSTARCPTSPPPASARGARCGLLDRARAGAVGPPRPVPVRSRYAERQREAFPLRAAWSACRTSGHWPFVDDPIAVRDAIVGFLAGRVGASLAAAA